MTRIEREGSNLTSGGVAALTNIADTQEHPEVLAWCGEVKRLCAEAEDRLIAGDLLPALSSLAAVSPLHRMLINRCSELLDTKLTNQSDELDLPNGMYL